MSLSKPSSSLQPAAGDDRNLIPVDAEYLAPSFEDRLRMGWDRYGKVILICVGLVLVGFVVKGVVDLLAAQREAATEEAYAAASDSAKLKSFSAAYPGHPLAGLAELRLADKAYTAERYGEAHAGYTKAATLLEKHVFGQRAQIGAAVSLVQAGKASEGEAALKQLMNNPKLEKSLRAEAAYHAAVQAIAGSRFDEASGLLDQVFSLDPTGQWTPKSFNLRPLLPPKPAAVAVPAHAAAPTPADAPAVSFPAVETKK